MAPDGRVIARTARGAEEVLITDLDLTERETWHARRSFLPDRRSEIYAGLIDSQVGAGA